MSLQTVEEAAAGVGLQVRGAFLSEPEDGVPDVAEGRPALCLVMLGNAGPGLWRAFQTGPEPSDGKPDALDRWSRRVIDGLARTLDARALYPFGGPPYRPFVAWAKRAEPVAESPLGMLIHPDHGLWHAYRGALAFAEVLALPPRDTRPRPCDSCADRPCLSACPVAAFTDQGYDVEACVDHIAASAGEDCLDLGCRARRACPVGREALYAPEQARFHMAAFQAARKAARRQ